MTEPTIYVARERDTLAFVGAFQRQEDAEEAADCEACAAIARGNPSAFEVVRTYLWGDGVGHHSHVDEAVATYGPECCVRDTVLRQHREGKTVRLQDYAAEQGVELDAAAFPLSWQEAWNDPEMDVYDDLLDDKE